MQDAKQEVFNFDKKGVFEKLLQFKHTKGLALQFIIRQFFMPWQVLLVIFAAFVILTGQEGNAS